jgi:hypothetical protein
MESSTQTNNRLIEADFIDAAKALACDIPAIKAVDFVESRGSGYLPDGRLKMLFEGHYFSRLTKRRFDLSHPKISYKQWTSAHYIGGVGEYARFNQAFALDPEAAMKSASWGRFQLMGENFSMVGFKSVGALLDAFKADETAHLAAFVAYIKAAKLDDDLQAHHWEVVARGYNGPAYWKNDYAGKLARAYDRVRK